MKNDPLKYVAANGLFVTHNNGCWNCGKCGIFPLWCKQCREKNREGYIETAKLNDEMNRKVAVENAKKNNNTCSHNSNFAPRYSFVKKKYFILCKKCGCQRWL